MIDTLDVIVVGAGPGGLSVACDLLAQGVTNILVLDRGTIGQSWLDYPPETRLLSETKPGSDENMISDIGVDTVCTNIPHPTHMMYQRYLNQVASIKGIHHVDNIQISKVSFDSEKNIFELTSKEQVFYCKFVVWAAGMYDTPNELQNSKHCYIHYSKIQNWDHIKEKDVTVIGSANGACDVVMQLAQPGRKVHLVCTHTFDTPLPIDCLWKENRMFIKDLIRQGLVDITEDCRVEKITHEQDHYRIEGGEGKTISSLTKPILCIGFMPNIKPISTLLSTHIDGHETILDLDTAHQSTIQPGLYLAGTIGKLTHDDGFIRNFRHFGDDIVKDIKAKLHTI